VLTAFAGQPEQLAGMPILLAAADLLEEAATVVIVGPDAAAALLQAASGSPDPATVVLRTADAGTLHPGHPAFGKITPPRQTVAYVCRRNVCGLPVADPAALSGILRARL
jgi:hypothetical protein